MRRDDLADMTSEMAEEASETSYGIRPEWGRWVIPVRTTMKIYGSKRIE